METFTTLLSSGLVLAVIAVPILIFWLLSKREGLRYRFLTYLVWSLVISAALIFAYAWWADTSTGLLLSFYGYDFDAVRLAERYVNVTSENLGRVKQLEASNMGTGWPLKGMFIFAFYSPYLLLVYFVGFEVKKYFNRLQVLA